MGLTQAPPKIVGLSLSAVTFSRRSRRVRLRPPRWSASRRSCLPGVHVAWFFFIKHKKMACLLAWLVRHRQATGPLSAVATAQAQAMRTQTV